MIIIVEKSYKKKYKKQRLVCVQKEKKLKKKSITNYVKSIVFQLNQDKLNQEQFRKLSGIKVKY